MRKLTLLLGFLMITGVGATYAHGKSCCKKGEKCTKGAKCCKDKKDAKTTDAKKAETKS